MKTVWYTSTFVSICVSFRLLGNNVNQTVATLQAWWFDPNDTNTNAYNNIYHGNTLKNESDGNDELMLKCSI